MHGHNIATHLGHGDLQGARAAVPARGATRPRSCAQIADEYYPQVLALLGVDGVTLTSERVEVPADPRALLRAVARRALGRRRAAAPGRPTTRSRRCSRRRPYPADHVVGVLPPRQRRRDRRARRGQRRDGRACEPAAFPLVLAALEALSEPEWNAFGLTTTTSSVFPMLHRERPVPRRARHRLPRRLHGRRRRPRLDDDRPRGLAVPAQHRRPARRRDDEVGVRPAGPLRLLHRRVGGAVAVAVARRAPRLHRRPRRRHRARRQGHVPDRRHPQRRRRAICSTCIAKSIAYPLANMFLGNAENGEVVRRDQPDVGRALRRRVPRRRRPRSSSCTSTPGSRSTSGPRRTRQILRDKGRVDGDGPRAPRRRARPDRADRVRRARQPARDRAPELRREPDAEQARGARRHDDGSRTASPAAVDEVARHPARRRRRPAAASTPNPKTARVHLRLVLDDVSLRGLRPPARRCCARRSTQSLAAARRRRVRARARRPAPLSRDATTASDQLDALERARRACTSRCCTTSSPRSSDDAGIDSGVFSALAYLDRARAAAPACR